MYDNRWQTDACVSNQWSCELNRSASRTSVSGTEACWCISSCVAAAAAPGGFLNELDAGRNRAECVGLNQSVSHSIRVF